MNIILQCFLLLLMCLKFSSIEFLFVPYLNNSIFFLDELTSSERSELDYQNKIKDMKSLNLPLNG